MNIVSRNVSSNLSKLISIKNTIKGVAWIKYSLSMHEPQLLGHFKTTQCKYFFANIPSFETH